MPNQNECDHVVAAKQGLLDGVYLIPQEYYRVHKKHNEVTEDFIHCPKCGAKIDWEAIKESVDNGNV